MSVEVVASDIKGAIAGSNGSTVATGAGTAAGADGFLDFLLVFFFLPPIATTPRQHSNSPRITSHCQTCNREPHDPDAADELSADPEISLAIDPVLKEPAEEFPEPEEPASPRPEPTESNEAEGAEPEEADESFPNADPESMELREPDPEEPDPDEADMFAADPKVDKRARARTIRIMVWGVV
jgi:hypothetical protein